MEYHLKASDAEWKIEPSSEEYWVLKKRTEVDWSAVGIYKSPNEAAVMVGAMMTVASRFGERHLNRLRFVLSGWEMVEQC